MSSSLSETMHNTQQHVWGQRGQGSRLKPLVCVWFFQLLTHHLLWPVCAQCHLRNPVPHWQSTQLWHYHTCPPNLTTESFKLPWSMWYSHVLVVILEKAMAPHSSTLAWKIPWTEEPGRLQSMGSLRVGQDWATSLLLFTFMHWWRKWQPTPVFLPGESQGQEPDGLPSMGSHRVGHDWSDLAAAAVVIQHFSLYGLRLSPAGRQCYYYSKKLLQK